MLQRQAIDRVIAIHGLQTVVVRARRGIGNRTAVLVIRITAALAEICTIAHEVGRIEVDCQPDNRVTTLFRCTVVCIYTTGGYCLIVEVVGLAYSTLCCHIHAVARQYGILHSVDRVIAILIGQTVIYGERADSGAGYILGVPMNGTVFTDGQRYIFLIERRIYSQVQSNDGVATLYCLQAVVIRTCIRAVLVVPDKGSLLVGDNRIYINQPFLLLLHDHRESGVAAMP